VSELVLTLLRLGFLALIWAMVLITVVVMRRDLRAPRDARPLVAVPGPRTTARPTRAPRPAKPDKPARPARSGPRSLVVLEGPLAGTDYASNQHSRVTLTNGTWVVSDLGSTNGTWVDRTRITGPTPLAVGQQLKVGRTVLELRK
jgi:pSer/pThr/pTyr-binding forkhead associated (FHA) protein